MCKDPSHSLKFGLTVREDIVVCYRGRGEAARRSVGVQFLRTDPLPAAVDPGSSPHCGRRALHHLSSRAAGEHGGVAATEAQGQRLR